MSHASRRKSPPREEFGGDEIAFGASSFLMVTRRAHFGTAFGGMDR
jgi:hypothetical protein